MANQSFSRYQLFREDPHHCHYNSQFFPLLGSSDKRLNSVLVTQVRKLIPRKLVPYIFLALALDWGIWISRKVLLEPTFNLYEKTIVLFPGIAEATDNRH